MADGDRFGVFEAAAVVAADRFGIAVADLLPVSHSENVTFRLVEAATGDSFVLRLHRPGHHTLGELDSERIWLAALEEAGVAVPHPLASTGGRYYEPVEIDGLGETRFAGLSHWRDGQVIDDLIQDGAEPSFVERSFTRLGRLMAAMHDQASAWSPPEGFERHRLDAEGFLGDSPWWGRFWEHPALTSEERRVLREVRSPLRSALDAHGRPSRTFSMIHADLHLGNVLVDGDDVMVIDFDDAGFGWHQYDIAVAFFHSRDTDGFDTVERAFIEGYRSVRSISDADLALVPTFELIRGLAIIGWKAQRPEVQWPDGVFDHIKQQALARCESYAPPF